MGHVRGCWLTLLNGYLLKSANHGGNQMYPTAASLLPTALLTASCPLPPLATPCRCYTACMWARLEHVYYGAKYEDVMEHGK
jgi:tRNA(Arg) A34 adenosine deaminase TadA